MVIDDILTEFGNFYIKGGQNMSSLYKQLHAKTITDSIGTAIFTDDTIFRASEARMDRVLQPFQKAWTPIGEVEFVPVGIEQFKMKVDSEESPDDLEASWLGFLSGPDIDRAQWPFVRWFIEMHLIPQLKQDYELNEVYAGEFAAPTPGTEGDPGTAMNGIKFLINKGIDDNRITPIVTGALETDPLDFCDQIEAFGDSINEKYLGVPMQLAMSKANELRFLRGYKKKYGTTMDYRQNTDGKVDLTALRVIGLPSMVGSDKIWATPKENFLVLGKKTANMDNMRVESVKRQLSFFTDFWRGVGFVIPEIVFTNDLEMNP